MNPRIRKKRLKRAPCQHPGCLKARYACGQIFASRVSQNIKMLNKHTTERRGEIVKERQLRMRFERKTERWRLHNVAMAHLGNSARHPLLVLPVANMLNHRVREDNIKIPPLKWQLTGIALYKREAIDPLRLCPPQIQKRHVIAIG